ncbi:MAG: hypothetical protein JWM99_5085 [Verrucomicrobiales bacterium]|nr:hypothetical protein [Verrucomicrobiales bacterium]
MRLLTFFAFLAFLNLNFAAEIILHVSPESTFGHGAAFTNVEDAVSRARSLREKDSAASITISLASGRYELSRPLEFGPKDSGGSAVNPLQIKADIGARPILSGGRRILGLKRSIANRNLWQVQLPEVSEKKWYFSELFVNGNRAKRARTPNTGFYKLNGPSPEGKPAKIKFKVGDIKKQWADAGDVELVALLAWADLRMQIKSVDEEKGFAVLSGEARPSNKESEARYYIENVRDALDEPGEFYLDRKTGVLSYLAKESEDLSTAEVIAPVLRELITIRGDFDTRKPVQHIVFRGITFSDTDWMLPATGYADTQAAVSVRGNLLAEGVTDLRVEDCVFTHLAGYAIELGKGAQKCRIVGNEISDLGAGGVRIGEGAQRTDSFEQNFGHVVSDNQIHDCGKVYPSAIGVFIMQSGTNLVSHNHIHHLFYTAVSVGWNWGYQQTLCRENVVEFNDLHDIGQGMLSDMGAVYTLGIQKGTIIRNNRIHDVRSYGYGGWGLYPDEGSSGILWENNLVYRCKSAGLHQHYGKENIIRNNIFALNEEHELMRTREEKHLSFFFTNNIIYFNSGDLLGSNWSNDQFVMNSNLYYDTRMGTNAPSFRFGNRTFAEWKASGHDTNSVIADPLFVSPEADDFRLKKDSPAYKIGFRTIDFSNTGPRRIGARTD